ncbi:DUF1553 domain-containing protein [Rubritalea tangerina]|uniref:DUF1553 domain-containing protein n=1 Tax=Rubritalea tangerina TaxID=430798 RepID=A0ABW4ZD88_9BACT
MRDHGKLEWAAKGALVLVCVLGNACQSPEKEEVVEAEVQERKIEYNFHIRPILSDKCFFCHGPDEKNNKAGLRLDTADAAYAALKEGGGHAIVPGDSAQSVVWQRIISDDPDLVMPPPSSKIDLTEGEKELIQMWIDQGAEFQEHWAFAALPEKVAVPDEDGAAWAKGEIDRFIAAKHKEQGLIANGEAEPSAWLRRVSFDLTGLPPSPEMVANFEGKDEAEYAQVVDRLLASESYGEHMAVAWLDAARYADSYGFQSDQLNGQWPYRDWVVRAFNQNLGYDKFLSYNLAGDLLDNPSREQVQATAFNRLHRLTNEGGSIREEFLVENAADRLHTFGTAVLGLTMECARCHDHKYDPISAKDYYSLYAFFNSIPENGLYDHPAKVPSPSILLPSEQEELALSKAKEKVVRSERELVRAKEEAEVGFQQWLKSAKYQEGWDGIVAYYDFEGEAGKIENRVGGADTKAGVAKGLGFVDGPSGRALSCDGDNGAVFSDSLHMDRYTPFSIGLKVRDGEQAAQRAVVLQKTFGTDVGYNGVDIVMEGGHLEFRIYRVWPGNGIGVRTKQALAKGEWKHVVVSYDGSSSADGIELVIDGEAVDVEAIGSGKLLKSASIKTYGSGHLTLGQRFRDYGFKGGAIDDLRIFERQLSTIESKALSLGVGVAELVNEEISEVELRGYYMSHYAQKVKEARKVLEGAWRDYVGVEDRVMEISVMKELAEPRPAHILERGEYSAERTEENRVERDVFESILPAFPEGGSRDRLGLSQWLMDPGHPLTSRVFVNRVWQNFFGVGLVSTPDNFGLQGALPSHPELLDWLSRDFIESGWDIKRLQKRIALSSTYRQSSAAGGGQLEKDPENRWLARGPAHRLGAEQVRDLALAASGLLNRAMGGPPVSPYQPGKDLWRESNGMSPAYRQSTGKALYRRSLYSVWKRTAPLPNMTAFDATSREVCHVKRASTNTPMQALVLLNDVQFIESARVLATRALESGEEQGGRLQYMFVRLAGREADERELELLEELYNQQLDHYKKAEEEAQKLVQHGESGVPEGVDVVELAAMTVVGQAILNLDASIWKR